MIKPVKVNKYKKTMKMFNKIGKLISKYQYGPYSTTFSNNKSPILTADSLQKSIDLLHKQCVSNGKLLNRDLLYGHKCIKEPKLIINVKDSTS